MIKYILKCKKKHEFESWFANSIEYEKLKKKKADRMYFLQIIRSNEVNYVSKCS